MGIPKTALAGPRPVAAAVLTLVVLLATGVSARAQEAGTRSVFDHGAGNRALAMGGAYGALADDASGLLWNPGGLGRVPRLEFQAGQTSYYALGIHEAWAMAAVPSYRWGAFAATFRYLGVSGIEVRDDRDFVVGDPTSDAQTELSMGYGHRIGESFSLGGTLKARHQSVAGFSASGFGIDAGVTGYPSAALGLKQEWASNLSVGLAISNLVRPSQRLDHESVADPMTFRTGLAWRERFAGLRSVVVSLDLEKPEALTPVAHLGFEFQPLPQLAIRGGTSGGTLTAGTGIRFHGVELDYAYENHSYDDLHRFGVSMAFGMTVDESREAARLKEEERLQARLEEGFRRRQTGQVDDLVERARGMRSRGEYEIALELLGTAAALDTVRQDIAPMVAACEIGQALQLEAAGDYSSAAIAYARALAAAPGDERAIAGHARCQSESDQRAARGDETKQWFAEAIDAYGSDNLTLARTRLQQVLGVMPDDREAGEMLRRTDDAIARRVRGLMHDARAHVEAGRWKDALTALDQVAATDSTAPGLSATRAMVARARTRAAADTAQARRASVPAPPATRSLPPKELDLLYRRGLAAMQEHRSDDALRYWEIVWSSSPGYARVGELIKRECLTRGMEAFAAGRLEDAVSFWRRALRVDPNDPRASGYIERAQKQLSRTREILGNND